MNKATIFVLLALVIATLAIHEIPVKHLKRSPREAKRLLEYMNRGPLAERINKILAKIFPSEMTPNIYAYPEVKILNYLDAQYYGYTLFHIDKSTSVTLPNNSVWSSTLDHPTFGCPPKNAVFPLLVIFTATTTLPRATPMCTMALISTSPMAQEQSQDSLDRTPAGLLDLKPKTLSSLRSPLFTESASLLPNLMAFSEWPGPLFQSTVFP